MRCSRAARRRSGCSRILCPATCARMARWWGRTPVSASTFDSRGSSSRICGSCRGATGFTTCRPSTIGLRIMPSYTGSPAMTPTSDSPSAAPRASGQSVAAAARSRSRRVSEASGKRRTEVCRRRAPKSRGYPQSSVFSRQTSVVRHKDKEIIYEFIRVCA